VNVANLQRGNNNYVRKGNVFGPYTVCQFLGKTTKTTPITNGVRMKEKTTSMICYNLLQVES